jgi:hypothetical protein
MNNNINYKKYPLIYKEMEHFNIIKMKAYIDENNEQSIKCLKSDNRTLYLTIRDNMVYIFRPYIFWEN